MSSNGRDDLRGSCGEAEFDPLDGPETIPAQLARSAARFDADIFLAGEDGERISFAETQRLARRAARAFLNAGMEIGDRAAIWAPNCIEWVIACLGIQLAGGVLVPLNTRFKGDEAAYILGKSRTRLLCTVATFLGNDYRAFLTDAQGGPLDGRPVAGLPCLRRIVALDRPGWDAFLDSGECIAEAALDARIAAVAPDSLADILFTSGTTGSPKGAMFNHRQALAVVRTFNFVNRTHAGDRALIVNPFFHSFGYRAGWVSCLIEGMTAYPIAELHPHSLMEVVERERITVLPGPPALFQTLIDADDKMDMSSLRIGITGSANFSTELARRCHDDLGLKLVLTSYGLTENTAMGTSCRPGDSYETLATTVGKPFPGFAMRLVDQANREVALGEPGEVCFRGFSVMQGYFEDAAATAAAIDSDGWLHTGDLGTVDERGYLKIVDRLKDVVIVGGFNVYPAEIERVLRDAPGVGEVAVVAMPDRRLGEVCAAFVVSSPGATLDEAALVAWSRVRMANFKVPRRFFAMDSLPKTPLGKVRKIELKAIASDGRAAGPAPAQPAVD